RPQQEDGRAGRRHAGAGRARARAHGELRMKIGLATAALLALPAAAAAEPLRRLPGTVPRALAAMTPAGRAPADLRLEHVTVFLGLRHRRAFEALIAAQQDRRSPLFHRWLGEAEIADLFGQRRVEYERARDWFVASA